MTQPFRNPEYLKNNIEKDFLGEENDVPEKDKNIARNRVRSLFLPV